jgi:hypothetical protein
MVILIGERSRWWWSFERPCNVIRAWVASHRLVFDVGGFAIDEGWILIHHCCCSSRQTAVDSSSRARDYSRLGITARPALELISRPVDFGQASA